MRIAAISDVHGNLLALQAVLNDIALQGADCIVNLGDHLSGPLQPAETADCLMTLAAAAKVMHIAGNHERQLLRAFEAGVYGRDDRTSDGYAAAHINGAHAGWLRALPKQRWLPHGVLLVHGTPVSDSEYWLESCDASMPDGLRAASLHEAAQRLHGDPAAAAATLVFCGHTHVPRSVRVGGGALVVNPGSVGLQAYDADHPHRHLVQVGTPHARYAIVTLAADGQWHVQPRAVPYDWHTQARHAAARGRADWAHALATGRVPQMPVTIAP